MSLLREQLKLQAKRQLYAVLLDIPHEELSDQEVDLMYMLAKDKQIQELLQQRLKPKGGKNDQDI